MPICFSSYSLVYPIVDVFLATLFFREKEYTGHCIAKIKVVSPSVSQDYQGKGLNLLTANRKTKCISCLKNGGLRLSDSLSMSL